MKCQERGAPLTALRATTPEFVQTYSVETDRLELLAPSFNDFLERQRREFEAVELDRQRMAAAYVNKRWWQFWIRPYPPGGAA